MGAPPGGSCGLLSGPAEDSQPTLVKSQPTPIRRWVCGLILAVRGEASDLALTHNRGQRVV